MKFKGSPNLYVKVSNKYIQRVTGKKGFYFNDKGEYETDNEILIKALEQNFETVKTKEELPTYTSGYVQIVGDKTYKCTKCDYKTDNKGELLSHYKSHKEV